jgi:hypothetical protein
VTAQLLGEAPASLGPAMDGLRLGMPAPVPPPIDQRVRGFVAARGATLAYDLAPTLRGLTIEGKLARSDGALIEHALTTRWGKPERNRAGDLVWLNGPEGTRVVLDLRLDAVSVTYAQHVTPNDLVQPDEPGRLVFEPTGGLLGKPLADAEAYLGPRGAGPGGARWELAPTGLGRASAALRVEVNAAGRIVSMTYGEAEADCASLVTALERKLGAPTSVTSDGSLRNWADGGRLTSLLVRRGRADRTQRLRLNYAGRPTSSALRSHSARARSASCACALGGLARRWS